MRRVDLPISRSFATRAIDLKKAVEELASGKSKKIPIGSIDFSCGKELDEARRNGGLIIWCAICLEQKLESIIARYVFPHSETNSDRGRQFFVSKIIKADIMTYGQKKSLVISLVNDEELLRGRDKDTLSKVLKKVMDFRNAFAHGEIDYEEGSGCVLHYWTGSATRDILNDDYWKSIEACFKVAHDLADKIIKQL
jgi:hypothetical protein